MNNNNFVVSIPKELKKIQSKLFFGLTKRQLIGFGTAIAIGISMFFLFTKIANSDVAMYALFFSVAPIFFITIYTKDGLPAEKWIKLIIEYNYIYPPKRAYKITKNNKQIAKERRIKFGTRRNKTVKTSKPNASTTNAG